MVNTFITFRKKISGSDKFTPDYKKSAQSLDRQRLLKQCVEAYQILNILIQLHTIAKLEGWEDSLPVETNEESFHPDIQTKRYLSRVQWVKNTRKKYLALSYRYTRIKGEILKFPKNSLPYKLYKDSIWEERESENVNVWVEKSRVSKVEKNFPNAIRLDESILPANKKVRNRTPFIFTRYQIALPEDEIFGLGFSQHAIVKMWVGYEDSLRDYINCHIEEYKKLTTKSGKQCSICLPKYHTPNNIVHPWWIVYYDGVIFSHRASLLRKEKEREETPRYVKNKFFTSIDKKWMELGYIWPGSFDEKIAEGIITDIISGKKIPPEQVAAPINADKKPRKSQEYLRNKYKYSGPYLLDQRGYIQIEIIKNI